MGQHPPERLRAIARWRALCLLSVVSLIVLGLGWELQWAPLRGGSGALALKVLPLTLCLTGLLRHRLRTYRALSLLVWLYMLEGLMRSTSEQGLSQYLAVTEVALASLLFTSCALYVRLRLTVLKSPSPEPAP